MNILKQVKSDDQWERERSSISRDKRDVFYIFFSKRTIDYISIEITRRLKGVHTDNKNIIVGDTQIKSVMDSIYTNTPRDIDIMIMMTISYIVDYVRNDLETERKNSKLNIWVTNFGPETGIRQHPPIKLREKGPTRFLFNMNY